MTYRTRRGIAVSLFAAALLCAAIGCAPPPRMPERPALPARPGPDAGPIAMGHWTYQVSCSHCHRVPDIDRVGYGRMQKALPRMIRAAKMSEAREADLRAYIEDAYARKDQR